MLKDIIIATATVAVQFDTYIYYTLAFEIDRFIFIIVANIIIKTN